MTPDEEVTLRGLIRDAREVSDRSVVTFLPFERLDEGFRITVVHGESGGKGEGRDQEFVYFSDLVERASGQNLLIESVCRLEARVVQKQASENRLWVGRPSVDG